MRSCHVPAGWQAQNRMCREAFYGGAHRLRRLRRSYIWPGSTQAARQNRKRGMAAPSALLSRLKSILETGSAVVKARSKVSVLLTLISTAKLGAPCLLALAPLLAMLNKLMLFNKVLLFNKRERGEVVSSVFFSCTFISACHSVILQSEVVCQSVCTVGHGAALRLKSA